MVKVISGRGLMVSTLVSINELHYVGLGHYLDGLMFAECIRVNHLSI